MSDTLQHCEDELNFLRTFGEVFNLYLTFAFRNWSSSPSQYDPIQSFVIPYFEGQTRPHGLDQNPAALFLTLPFRAAAIPPNLVPNAPLSGCVMGPKPPNTPLSGAMT